MGTKGGVETKSQKDEVISTIS